MFNAAIAKSECFTRGVRIASFLLMVLGICLFFSPITTLIGYIPLVGGFISGVIGFAILLAAVIVCLPLYLIATSIAWLVFRPKVGLILIGIGLVIAGVVIFFLTKSPSNSGGNGSPSHA